MKKAQAAKRKAQVAKAKISTTKPAATAPTTQQAPYPEAFTKNPPPVAARYVPGLMVPGNQGYKEEFGGGGWVAGVSDYDGPNYNSIADIKDWYKAMAATGGSALGSGSWEDIRAAAATYKAPTQGSETAAASTASNAALASPRTVKSLKGAGAVVSKQEFKNIMRTQGVTAQKLLERAGRRGMALGAGVVNAVNEGKFGSNLLLPNFAGQTSDFVQGMKGLTLSRGQQYSGTYEADGKQVPIVQARPGATGLTGYSQPTQAGTAGESSAVSGGKVQKLRAKLQKTKALIKSSQSELAARGL